MLFIVPFNTAVHIVPRWSSEDNCVSQLNNISDVYAVHEFCLTSWDIYGVVRQRIFHFPLNMRGPNYLALTHSMS